MSPLKSITELDNPGLQYFAGTVKYTLKFSVPKAQLNEAKATRINFGKLDATAAVKLKERRLVKFGRMIQPLTFVPC